MRFSRLLRALILASIAFPVLTGSAAAGEDLHLSYRSSIDNKDQPYRLYVPTGYDGKTAVPLVIALHGTSGDQSTLFDKYGDGAIKRAAEKHGLLLVSPFGRGVTEYYGIGENDVFCALADVRSRYRVDPDRIYVTGHSMGGTGAARLALQHPDVFAAAAPLAPAFSHPHLAPNAAYLPLWWILGGDDEPFYLKGVLPGAERTLLQGHPHRISILPGRGHGDWVPEYFDPVFEWLLKNRRVAHPRQYVFAALTPMHGRAYSTSIDGIAKPGTVGTLNVRIEDRNLIRVQADNVSAFAVLPMPPLFDLSVAIRVVVEEKPVFEGVVTEGQEIRCTFDAASGWKADAAKRRKHDVTQWRSNPVATSDRELRMEGVEAPLANWITDAMRRAMGADIALYNRFAYRGLPIPAGAVDMVDLIQASRPFEQMLVTTELQGRDLLEILDAAVPETGGKLDRLVQVSGIRYAFDRRRPKGSRIVSSDLEAERRYKVVLEGQVPERQSIPLAGRFGTLKYVVTEIPFMGALYGHAAASGRITVDDERRVREITAEDCLDERPRLKPTAAGDAIKTFKLAPGYRIELVAAEPLVASPVDLAFDEEGRLWVVEMVDYPFHETEGNPAQGRVVRLEDKDGDGAFDTRVVIADKISCPTGLALWDGGAFVTAAPVLLYVKEGVRRIVQSGFGVENIQGLANNIKWGLDNWFHAAGGLNGGTIAPAGIGIKGRDFRFRPSGEFEALSGSGQFGSSFDDFGRRFVCSNANSAMHIVIDDAVLKHNPHYAVSAVTASIAAEGGAGTVYRASPPERWRELRTQLRKEGKLTGVVEGMTTFTGASGIFFHKGRLYVGEVSHNLISRKSLAPSGSTFKAERFDKQSEFLASTDNWFRPANLATGPDGALYVADMYRECIEHPRSLPDFIKKHLDLTSGKDRGRIWRIIEEDGPKYAKPKLGDLAASLARPEAWYRQTAARLIYHKQDKSLAPAIEKLLAHERPEVRAAALWALEGLGLRRGELLLKDPSRDVREQAVRLSQVESLFEMSDESPRVKFALACRLAESKDPRAKAAAERLKPGADRWLQTVIAIAEGQKSPRPPPPIDPPTVVPPTPVDPDRKKVVESYRGALALKGDPLRGREVYRKSCMGCHRAAGEGKDVGPDLATVKQKTPEELLISIFDPNREINQQFVSVRIRMKSEQILDGLIGAENATSLTLKRAEGLVDTLLKDDIDKMVRSSLSLMPEGLEKTIDQQQLADLIRFLRE